MSIITISEPVQKELQLVKSTMQDITRVELPQLAEPLGYILEHEGKQVRPVITLLVGKLYNFNVDILVSMAASVEFLHLASLLHDDTIDNSAVRRGEPTVQSIWGGNTAILIGDYIFAKSAYLISTIGSTEIMSIFSQTLMSLCSGVLEESSTAHNYNLSRAQYYKRIESKTASLISLASESGAILSNAPEKTAGELKSYGYNMGMAFQIVDDILDFTGEQEELGKPVGNDLFQGILTLPAILLIEQYPKDNPIKELFEGKQVEKNLKLAIEMILNSSVIEQSYKIANEFCSKCRQILHNLPDSAPQKSLLELVDYVTERRK